MNRYRLGQAAPQSPIPEWAPFGAAFLATAFGFLESKSFVKGLGFGTLAYWGTGFAQKALQGYEFTEAAPALQDTATPMSTIDAKMAELTGRLEQYGMQR